MKNVSDSGRTRGFTLIEVAVVISIVGFMAAVLLSRLGYYQEQAEKVAMEQTVGALRSALHLQAASLLAKNRIADLPELLKQNPMNWLAEKPQNYLGEFYAPDPQDIEPGHWYFDLLTGNLIYSIRSATHFRLATGTGNLIRFRIQLVKGPKVYESASDNVIEGVTLEPVVLYQWF